ncbi:histidinol dehydrogenase, partial [Alphaproteobacteria bacterium]|nr:histidinol dehydrogenase [Alphaproteobacteria bacterium]
MKVVNKKWIFDNLNSSINTNPNVSLTVKKIIEDIKKNKDKALLKYVKKFENKNANLNRIIIPKKNLKEA